MKTYPHTFSGRKASQSEYELGGFIDFLKQNNVTSYCEIGAREGDTFHEVMLNLPVGSKGLAVDLPGGLWGKKTTASGLIAAVNDLKEKGYDVSYLFDDSQNKETAEIIESFGPFDAILIDGDHTLAGVTKDWNNYSGMAPLIAFHDIVGTGQFEKVYQNPVEVPILWESLKQHYKTVEFIDTESKMGIGVCLRLLPL